MPAAPTRSVNVAIIGAGTAGMAAYRAAAARTDRVLLIEADRYGTTCARVGCMPSKLLVAAADAAHHVATAPVFGVHAGAAVRVDGREVMDRVRRERDRFVDFVLESATGFPEAHRLMGRARFIDAHTLAVGEGRVHADAVVVATGSRPRILPQHDALGDRVVVNDDVFAWEALPRSVAVFGLGIIGLELGQALHRLGVRVGAFGAGGLIGPLTDPGIRSAARDAFAHELRLDPDARVHGVERVDGGVALTFEQDGEVRTEVFEYLLAATGRTPNLDGLGLERTGLTLDARGVPLYDPLTMRCGESSIFIAGDADGDLPLLHEAADEGRIAGDNAGRFPDLRPGLRRSPLAVMFTDPQIAMVGSTWAQLQGRPHVVGAVSFEDQGRSRVMNAHQGRLHLYAEAGTGRLLGAEMVGPRAEHLAHLLAWSHQQGLGVARMLEMPFYHPVVEEGLRTALRDAAAKLAAPAPACHPTPRSLP